MILTAALIPLQSEGEPSPPIALAWREGLLCAPVTIGEGRPLWFLLDTGAQRSFVTKRTLARLVAGGAVPLKDGTLEVGDVRIGGYPVPPLRLGDEADGFTQSVEGAADGYLGMDLLARYQVGLDLREKTLRLWPVGATMNDWFTAPPESRLSLPILRRSEGWCVPVEVGNLVVPMVLDTGAAATYLHTDVASALRGAKKAKGAAKMLPFFDGLHRVRTYAVRDVGLGGLSFGERTISVASVPSMVGLLGRDLLSPLKVLLDYPGGKATFAGLDGPALPKFGGPTVTFANGVMIRWPLGESATAPPGCAYTLPAGYREILRPDERVDLVPPR